MNRKRALTIIIGLPLTYIAVLLVLGLIAEGSARSTIRETLQHVLRADEIEIEDIDVGLLRGQIEVSGISAKRSGVTVDLTIESIKVEMSPLGGMLFQQEPKRVTVSGAHLQLSALGAATLRQEPFHVDEFVLENSSVTLVVSSLFPSIAKAKFEVKHARVTNLEMRNTMSWLYNTDELDAQLVASGGIKITLTYSKGALALSGSLLGSKPITIPFAWPIPNPLDMELTQLLDLATSLTKVLVKEFAKEFAEDKIEQLWDSIVDGVD